MDSTIRPKTILIISDNLPDQINGVVTTFRNIESYAARDGYRVVYLDPRQFPHCNAPGYPEVKLSLPWQIGKKIAAVDADYIHIATEGPIGAAASIWLWKKGWRYNTSYHTKFPEFLKQIYGIPESWTYRYVRWFHKHSGVVLTTTKTMVNDLVANRFTGNIIPWTRGVDRTALCPTIDHVPHKVPVVLYVGRISKEKNLEELCKLQDDYTIRVVGDGPDRQRLEDKYKNVTFVGYKSGSDLADEFVSASVFAFPSRTDTFGIVIIEALSVGTPVAAYPVPGPIDILDEHTGVMDTDLKTAINQAVMLDRSSVKSYAEKWTWESCWQIFKHNLVEVRYKS